MSAEEIECLVQETEHYKVENEVNKARIESKNTLENYTYQQKNSLNEEKLSILILINDK